MSIVSGAVRTGPASVRRCRGLRLARRFGNWSRAGRRRGAVCVGRKRRRWFAPLPVPSGAAAARTLAAAVHDRANLAQDCIARATAAMGNALGQRPFEEVRLDGGASHSVLQFDRSGRNRYGPFSPARPACTAPTPHASAAADSYADAWRRLAHASTCASIHG
jgi:hypothetical protein